MKDSAIPAAVLSRRAVEGLSAATFASHPKARVATASISWSDYLLAEINAIAERPNYAESFSSVSCRRLVLASRRSAVAELLPPHFPLASSIRVHLSHLPRLSRLAVGRAVDSRPILFHAITANIPVVKIDARPQPPAISASPDTRATCPACPGWPRGVPWITGLFPLALLQVL